MADGAGIPGGDNRGDHILQAGLNGLLLQLLGALARLQQAAELLNLCSELGTLVMQRSKNTRRHPLIDILMFGQCLRYFEEASKLQGVGCSSLLFSQAEERITEQRAGQQG
ncbi:hypothetical protein D3C72_1946840 [compost metagenome]